MTNKDFYDKMQALQAVSGTWGNLLSLLREEMNGQADADQVLNLLTLYFSLLDDGNAYMPLDKTLLQEKINKKIAGLESKTREDEGQADYAEIRVAIEEALRSIRALQDCAALVGEDKLFATEDNRLYARKYLQAVRSIRTSAERLFTGNVNGNSSAASFHLVDCVDGITLEPKQEEVVTKGLENNLLVTGGPGTGKTTSILFLLVGLLTQCKDRKVYLTAPSGKAAKRMTESISEEVNHVKNVDGDILDKIKELEGKTIHSLLEIDRDTNRFTKNKERPFEENAVFIIDEASMIDVCLFAALLDAIPDKARVFILGDRNQLPSVQCGAVFGDLLEKYAPNVVELTTSKRFPMGSDIYNLAESINDGTLTLDEHAVELLSDFLKAQETTDNQVYYYRDDASGSEIVKTITGKWYQQYFGGFIHACKGVNEGTSFGEIMERAEQSKILCAQNESARGTTAINKTILDTNYKGQKKTGGFYPGEVLMVTKNLKALGLANGDCGVTVQFEGDDTLYFMIKKSGSELNLEPGKKKNDVFCLYDDAGVGFYFYPIRLIGPEDITSAFAITIHKAQGSGYTDVYIVLPKNEGHPLLNRQLLYTAVTRTKKKAYIISNKINLEYAAKTVIERDTGV